MLAACTSGQLPVEHVSFVPVELTFDVQYAAAAYCAYRVISWSVPDETSIVSVTLGSSPLEGACIPRATG